MTPFNAWGRRIARDASRAREARATQARLDALAADAGLDAGTPRAFELEHTHAPVGARGKAAVADAEKVEASGGDVNASQLDDDDDDLLDALDDDDDASGTNRTSAASSRLTCRAPRRLSATRF